MNKLIKTIAFTLMVLIMDISNSFCQELFFGRNFSEISSNTNGSKVVISINGKKAIKEVVDSNIGNIFIFNADDICIEYDLIYINSDIEQVNNYLQDYYKKGEIYENTSKGLFAIIQTIADNTYKIRFIKKYDIYNNSLY